MDNGEIVLIILALIVLYFISPWSVLRENRRAELRAQGAIGKFYLGAWVVFGVFLVFLVVMLIVATSYENNLDRDIPEWIDIFTMQAPVYIIMSAVALFMCLLTNLIVASSQDAEDVPPSQPVRRQSGYHQVSRKYDYDDDDEDDAEKEFDDFGVYDDVEDEYDMTRDYYGKHGEFDTNDESLRVSEDIRGFHHEFPDEDLTDQYYWDDVLDAETDDFLEDD